MEDKNTKFLCKLKEKLKNISNKNIYLISLLLSGAMTYKYGVNRFLYMEHHGHFNSPQNMLNRKVFQHHMQEIFLRFGFGFFGLSAILFMARGIYRGDQLEKESEEKKKSNNDKEKLKIDIFKGRKNFEFTDALPAGDIKSDTDEIFNLDEMIKNKKVIDGYIKDKNKF